ncbi:MAG: GPP34 family phosphoprotein [Nonomuraea sp.]|nr:GPP34 family phosphoprotein [Nonomuraea sp.]NUS06046.1 GPP34 family phosphoprotein [Nonomuraea sp.]NUT43871.1 GPP34 family phosphoprotein [Thermoactinospora sp.]
MTPTPLHQELFLIAHDQSGKPLVHQHSMALGLAGAVLLDLALSERVTLVRGRVEVADHTPFGDPVVDSLIPMIVRDRADRDARFWIKKLAEDVHDRTRQSLVGAGVLVMVTRRRLGMLPYTRYQLADIASVVRASAGVRSAVEGWKQPDGRGAALCGLVGALRVEAELYLDQPSARLIERLRAIASEHSPVVKEIVSLVDTMLGEAAVAVFR